MGSAKLESGLRYDMPPGFGPSVIPDVELNFDLHGSSVEFETSPEALSPLLPSWFRPAPRPVLSVGYRHMKRMAWMGGRDYRLVTIRATTVCDVGGKAVTNPFALVIWETDCAPILAGRELLGAPKLFGDIPEIEVGGGDHEFVCREYEFPLLRAKASDLRELSQDKVAEMRELQKGTSVYYWKYIPGLDGRPDADYPVAFKMHTPFVRMWKGNGRIEFAAPSATQAPYSSRIIRKLAELPRLSEVSSVVFHATECQLFRNQTVRLDTPAR